MAKPKTIFDLDLVKIGRRQRSVYWCAVAIVALLFTQIMIAVLAPGAVSGYFLLGLSLLYWLVALAGVVFVVRLQAAMGTGVIGLMVYAIAALLLTFLVLLAVHSQASTVLRLAGAKVGLNGVSDDELRKLVPGHCRGCGYDRVGLEPLQDCPECSRTPLVI
ncbi:MAG: hypothetical protein AAGA55_06775 [Planctomycetota bacterium]